MDGDDRVHVAAVKWEWSTPSGTGGIWYLTDAGRTPGDFGTPTRIAGSMMTSPSLRVADGARYLAYAKCDCLPMQSSAPLFFKTDRSGSWETERIANVAYDPSLRLDRKGRARIVYGDRQGPRYTKAGTRTGDFTTPARIPGTTGLEGTPSLALDDSERAHVAWSTWKQGHPVFYIERTSAGWSTPLQLGNGTMTELSIDASGQPHVVLGWGKVTHRWLAGGTWQSSDIASDVSPMDAAIRGFGTGATIAWSQDVSPRGVWSPATDPLGNFPLPCAGWVRKWLRRGAGRPVRGPRVRASRSPRMTPHHCHGVQESEVVKAGTPLCLPHAATAASPTHGEARPSRDGPRAFRGHR